MANAFKGFGLELLERIRQDANDRLDESAFEERVIGIKKATTAMVEADVDRDTVIKMLQKHWDLRLSEATAFINDIEYAD